MAKFTPFPTFGGKDGIAGITPVKLAPTQMRFPTASRPASRKTVEPDTSEQIAPLLPFLFEGVGNLINRKSNTPLNREDYLESIGADPENLTKLEEAKADAYSLYGPETEKDTFGFDDIFDIVAASQLGRGGDDYAKSVAALNRAKETDRITKEASRVSFIKSELANKYTKLMLQDNDKAKLGINDVRPANYKDGEYFVLNDDKTDYVNIKDIPGNWIEPGDADKIVAGKNPALAELNKMNTKLKDKDFALTGTLAIAVPALEMIQQGIDDPKMSFNTVVSSVGNFANDAAANTRQLFAYKQRDEGRVFATAEDVGKRAGGVAERAGTGENAKRLYEALETGDEAAIEAAIKAFDASGVLEEFNTDIYGKGNTVAEVLGELAYGTVRTKALLLQLAYSAAAANGQTGRTLSDKDLAYHLQIIGFGASQDSKTLYRNLMDFIDTLVEQTDGQMGAAFGTNEIDANLRGGLYSPNDAAFTSMAYTYYDIPELEDGTPDFFNVTGYRRKGFYDRFGNEPNVKKYRNLARYGSNIKQSKEKQEEILNFNLQVDPNRIIPPGPG